MCPAAISSKRGGGGGGGGGGGQPPTQGYCTINVIEGGDPHPGSAPSYMAPENVTP